jgi:NAD+ synthase (glutamine-hydrolysing)
MNNNRELGHTKPYLVLSCGNVDESLRGYYTKYDCSSGDLNLIGSISKVDLKRFMEWGSEKLNYSTLKKIIEVKKIII